MDALLRCAVSFAHRHPDEAATRLEAVRPAEIAGFLDNLEPAPAAAVLNRMTAWVAAGCLEQMEDPRAAELLGGVDDRQRVRMLRQLGSDRREALLAALPEESARRARRALSLPEGSAGAMADTAIKALPSDMTAAAARAVAKDPKVPYLYVVDREHRLVGVVHQRDVHSIGDHVPLEQALVPDVTRVSAHATVAQLRRHRAWRDLDALPVVDGKGRFLGAIRHKDLRRLETARTGAVTKHLPMTIVLDLAELFWVGLSDVLRGLSVTSGVEGATK